MGLRGRWGLDEEGQFSECDGELEGGPASGHFLEMNVMWADVEAGRPSGGSCNGPELANARGGRQG